MVVVAVGLERKGMMWNQGESRLGRTLSERKRARRKVGAGALTWDCVTQGLEHA